VAIRTSSQIFSTSSFKVRFGLMQLDHPIAPEIPMAAKIDPFLGFSRYRPLTLEAEKEPDDGLHGADGDHG
jgi:hypothetical protein